MFANDIGEQFEEPLVIPNEPVPSIEHTSEPLNIVPITAVVEIVQSADAPVITETPLVNLENGTGNTPTPSVVNESPAVTVDPVEAFNEYKKHLAENFAHILGDSTVEEFDWMGWFNRPLFPPVEVNSDDPVVLITEQPQDVLSESFTPPDVCVDYPEYHPMVDDEIFYPA